MSYDVSVLIPGIRTHNWQTVIDTLRTSCSRHSFEVVFSGPFDPPPTVAVLPNVKYFKTYACPSVAGQLGSKLCDAKLLLHSVDDAHFIPDAVNKAIDLYNARCSRKDAVNMRYTEDANFSGKTSPPEYWFAHHHVPLRLPGIPANYRLALHFLIDLSYFRELGGFDCRYEYMNLNLHDLMFRLQYDGGVVYDSPTDITNCDHFCGRSGDHAPIHDAYGSDIGIFNSFYGNPNALHPGMVRIDFDNWRQQPEIWQRRFKKLYNTYDEMMRDQ